MWVKGNDSQVVKCVVEIFFWWQLSQDQCCCVLKIFYYHHLFLEWVWFNHTTILAGNIRFLICSGTLSVPLVSQFYNIFFLDILFFSPRFLALDDPVQKYIHNIVEPSFPQICLVRTSWISSCKKLPRSGMKFSIRPSFVPIANLTIQRIAMFYFKIFQKVGLSSCCLFKGNHQSVATYTNKTI